MANVKAFNKAKGITPKEKKKRTPEEVTQAKKEGQKYISEREKLATKQGVSSREAGETLAKREDAAKAGRPERVAERNIAIDIAENKLRKERVKASQQDVAVKTEEEQAVQEEEKEGRSLLGSFIKGPEELDDAVAGTLPISPAGGLGIIKNAPALAGKAVKTAKMVKIEDIMKGWKGIKDPAMRAITREVAVNKIARIGNIRPNQALRAINSYNKWSKPAIFKFLSAKTIATGAFAVASTDVILSWYALDNVASGMTFLVPRVEEGMQLGTITDNGEEIFGEADVSFDLAMKKVNQSARYNPLMWAARKLITNGAKLDKAEYDLAKANFLAKSQAGLV